MKRMVRGAFVWCGLSWLGLLGVPDALAQRASTSGQTSPPPALTLAVMDDTAAVGRFTYDGGTIIFESHQFEGGGRLSLRRGDLSELLTIEEDADFIRTSVLGGRATQMASKSILREAARQARLPEQQRSAFPARYAIVDRGDEKAFEELTYSKDGGAIVSLSAELGKQGMHGGAFPSTTALHLLAMRIGTANSISPPPPPAITFNSCQDLQSNPNGDDCFGMCGPGCSCWSFICGDCCCYDGCKSHDITCRNCTWWRPLSCALCYSFTSFFAGACGSSCQATQWAEGNVRANYEVCGINAPWADFDCGGRHNGSTEAQGAPVQWECQYSESVYQCSFWWHGMCEGEEWWDDVYRCKPR